MKHKRNFWIKNNINTLHVSENCKESKEKKRMIWKFTWCFGSECKRKVIL